MILRCEEISDLIGPFALDALEPKERLLVLEHLSECRRHDTELAEYRDVATLLPLALGDVAPPARVRSALLQEFADQQRLPASQAVPVVKRSFLDFFRRPAFAYGLAAALVLAIAGLAAWNVSLQQDDPPFVVRTAQQGNMSLRVVYLPQEQLAVINLELQALPPERAYQAWGITDAGPISLGLVNGRGPTAIYADLSDATAIAFSIEPVGGSFAPTTTPFLLTKL